MSSCLAKVLWRGKNQKRDLCQTYAAATAERGDADDVGHRSNRRANSRCVVHDARSVPLGLWSRPNGLGLAHRTPRTACAEYVAS